MNSNYGRSSNPQKGGSFDFDLGIGSNRSTSLNDKRNNASSSSSSYSSPFSSNQPKPSTLPNKPTWVHQSAPSNRTGLPNGPTSMVGDISGKSWNSTAPSSGIGIVVKNPNLFGDLVGSALGQGKTSANAPLKSAAPLKNAYSMGNVADSLPKVNNPVNSSGNWGSTEKFGNFTSSYNSSGNGNKGTNLGGSSLRSGGSNGGGLSSNKDPFGSLVDFTSKPSGNINAGIKTSKPVKVDDPFGGFQNAPQSNTQTNSDNIFMGPTPVSDVNMGSFESFDIPKMNHASPNPPSVQKSNVDPLDMLFSNHAGPAMAVAEGIEDWGMESEFDGGNDGGGMTTEIEGLPPPPAGVTGSSAKNKGMDNYKQGQYANAIKWLSWAVILLEKKGDHDAHNEVLSSRASCYKEVGEYKKAVADCTKVLEHDGKNVSVLVQRALLYESMEKYRLGAEDLRTVLKIDPSNRVARSTVHRLTKMAD